MRKHVLMLTTSAFILACGGASAQQTGGPMIQQPDHQPTQQQPMDREGRGMMGRGMMGQGMMSRGMIGQGMMMRMIFALMDGDGDETISLPEFQAAHERLFKAMDANKDGRLTMEEMQSFMQGTRTFPRQ
jgi:Ca2+-binding EF-hand superfamily protein